MEMKQLDKAKLSDFVSYLQGSYTVYAPVKRGVRNFAFNKIDNPGDVVIEYTSTVLPPKKIFQPEREVLIKYNMVENTAEAADIKVEPKVILGMHSYDRAAVDLLDYAFTTGNPEKNYLTRRENTIFIGTTFVPDNYHFTNAVGMDVEDKNGFDIFIYPAGSSYLFEALTDKGKEIVNGFNGFTNATATPDKLKRTESSLGIDVSRLPGVLEVKQDSPVWGEYAKRCFGCGSCTLVCPTCYCFDVYDDTELSLKEGSRVRRWDSCQNMGFTEVAGGEVFREKRANRVRHRIYRKFKYITDKIDKPFCVGCGRCGRQCTADIQIPDIISDLAGQKQLTEA